MQTPLKTTFMTYKRTLITIEKYVSWVVISNDDVKIRYSGYTQAQALKDFKQKYYV